MFRLVSSMDSLDMVEFGRRFYPSLIPPLQDLTSNQRDYIPRRLGVISIQRGDSIEQAQDDFIKFSL